MLPLEIDLKTKEEAKFSYMARKKSKGKKGKGKGKANTPQSSKAEGQLTPEISTADPLKCDRSSVLPGTFPATPPTTSSATLRAPEVLSQEKAEAEAPDTPSASISSPSSVGEPSSLSAMEEPSQEKPDAEARKASTVEKLAAELAKLSELIESVKNMQAVHHDGIYYPFLVYQEPYELSRASASRSIPGLHSALAIGVMDCNRIGTVLSKLGPLELLSVRNYYRDMFGRELMDDVRDNRCGLVVRRDPETEYRILPEYSEAGSVEYDRRSMSLFKAVGQPAQEQMDTLSPAVGRPQDRDIERDDG
ncbi:uncharacterized protein BP01DRAFT_72847 [Aspergillus saccharolyticus JOP 1030-1]|uniref:Uncharacterized protein n=1 Tax=Aspergillus saccharolyticus JOP 1030-1 TaxID=1450539 RepID=A0A318ZYA5_9EURO|nr:hypothetical protein BP01DRAFT_72847 [Aspergillus saccharolyticus JOP 1030-1]PYH49180.1 hypothetical protein BP01DRAFT_72847 [Aspergillus saccharolyticus JOP 1030-1]